MDLVSAAATARLYKLLSAQCIGSLQSKVYNIHALNHRDLGKQTIMVVCLHLPGSGRRAWEANCVPNQTPINHIEIE